MKITLGILAYNEADTIGKLIPDLFRQTLLSNDNISLDIHVVANGCTDATVQVASQALARQKVNHGNIRWFVQNVLHAGKSNAWNELIHSFASLETEYIFLLDADIRIPEETTLEAMVNCLRRSRTAVVAVDQSVSDLLDKADRSLVESLIASASSTAYDTRTAICGQLYCAKFSVLKNIWMPIGLPGEDGFLRAMLLTSNFESEENLDRIVFVEDARHIFESERGIRAVFRHNIRLAIGTAINVLLFNHIREACIDSVDLSDYIKMRNAADPNWLNELIANEIAKKRYFLLNTNFILKRVRRLWSLSITEQLRKWPVFLLGVVFDTVLFFTANHLMRRGAGAGFW